MARGMIAGPGLGQGAKKVVSIKSILGSAEFRRGFEDCKAGKPFDASVRELKGQWAYERGRQFACLWPHATFKRGRMVHHDAIAFYVTHRKNGDIR